MPVSSGAQRTAAWSVAGCERNGWGTPMIGLTDIRNSGPSGSISLPHFWRKTHGRRRNQTKPHHQAPVQSAAGKSLRRVDGSGKSKALDGARRDKAPARRKRSAHWRPLSLVDAGAGRRTARCERRLPRSDTEREAGLYLGLEIHARTRVAGNGDVQARRRWHHHDAAARAVLRRSGSRPP